MKQKLVVEVIGAHNLMPKDGEGSSSPFIEVEFDNQRLRTKVIVKDLNPIWNEKLFFDVNDVNDLPYKNIEVNVFNEKKSNNINNGRNFLGKVRICGSNICSKKGEEIIQLFTLEKRSLFSHVRGEITLKLYLSINSNNGSNKVANNSNVVKKGSKKVQNASSSMVFKQEMVEKGKNGNFEGKNNGEVKAVVITTPQNVGVEGNGGRGILGIYNNNNNNNGNNNISNINNNMNNNGGGVFPTGTISLGNEFSLKETKPNLGGSGGPHNKDKTSSTYDLVEQMQYLYVRVVKCKDLCFFTGGEILAEVKLGNYKGITKRVGVNNGVWDQVFAFSKDCIQSSMVEVFVKERESNDFYGRVWFDLNDVPKRVPPDSQLAPQWYRMEDRRGDKAKAGEVMVSIWFGTQADEAFAEAWHSKAANVVLDGVCSIKSKVYLSPRLWYLRVNVIEAQDVLVCEKSGGGLMRYPEFFVKVQVGNQVLRTRVSPVGVSRPLNNPFWNEDLMFVVPEPFEDYVVVSVEDRVGHGREDVVGRLAVPVSAIDRRWDDKAVPSRWFNLDNNSNQNMNMNRFGSRVHIRASLDGGYHVLDEATMYCSDVRPSAKQLWKPEIGVLEVGILGATGLIPMKMKEGKGGATDAYCVAKYGQKWVRSRTVVDSLSPKWNEQYTWEVYDPCTVITIGVFDNCRIDRNMAASLGGANDSRIGKVRIRLSTLETDRVYTHSYPLLMLHPSGVKKTGELHLAVRFSCTNIGNMLNMYTNPLLPKMHYVQPLSVNQLESLRYQATNVVAARLSRSEPSLGREVVEYMLDHDSHMWSMRKSKANFFRLMNVVSGLAGLLRWIELMRSWQRPVYSSIFVLKFLLLVTFPELIIPTVLIYMALLGIWRYRSRPRHPPHMDTRLSRADNVYPDELDEEFDTFPTSRSAEIIRIRYDRLRSVAGRIQTVVGDMATQGERFQALLSWRDPRATFLFIIMCVACAIGFYAVPMKVVVALWGVYYLRPPKFRSKLPPKAFSFFRRLPSNADSLL